MSKSSSLSLLLGSVLLNPAAAAQAAQAFASSLDTIYQLSAFTAPTLNSANQGNISSTWSGTIDDMASGKRQLIDGFGAAITDATVDSFTSLPNKQYKKLISDLFSTTNGIGMTLMRHSIGASDLSAYAYTYDDVSANSTDLKLKKFNVPQPGRAQTQFIKDMRAENPNNIKLLGSPWSAPGWMKTGGQLQPIGNNAGNYLNLSYAAQFAQYFVDYLQGFEDRGVHVDAITIQNEPLNNNPGSLTMVIEGQDSAGLIENHVGPALKAANLTTEIWAYDHNTDRPDYPQAVLEAAPSYVNNVAWHCYANPLDWSVLDNFRANNTNVTNLGQYMTECWLSPLTSWYQSIYYILQPLQHWSRGSIGWTLGTFTTLGPHLPTQGACNSCRGIVEVDRASGTYIKTMDYYFFGQFTKFMRRGAQVLATTGSYDFGGGSACEYTATLNADGTRTVVIYNGFSNELYITLSFESGEQWSGPLYQFSLTTWVLPPTTG